MLDTSRWNGPWRKSQLRAFLERDESLLHPTASSCDQDFVGWELFDRWRSQRRVWYVRGPGAAPNGGLRNQSAERLIGSGDGD